MTEEIRRRRVLVVVPARYGSTRFPGKALADLEGHPLIVRVMENAARIAGVDRVVAATDDTRILNAVKEAGFEAVMTGRHETGTGRVGEVARNDAADIVVNLRGDEPLLESLIVEDLLKALEGHPDWDIATCGHSFAEQSSWCDPNAVKVVVTAGRRALYFSRAPIPGSFPGRSGDGSAAALRHVGIYAFRRQALDRFLSLPTGILEACEGLEQLRAMENGMTIGVVTIASAPVGVDTPADLEVAREAWRARSRS